jgi:hypothetical protein
MRVFVTDSKLVNEYQSSWHYHPRFSYDTIDLRTFSRSQSSAQKIDQCIQIGY